MVKKITLVFIFLIVAGSAFAQEAIEGSFITVNGKKLWYHKIGKGEPLLLIPGGGAGSHHYFRPGFDKLAEKFTVVYFDSFGRGHSERAKNVNEYSFSRDIDDIEALRKALNLGKIHVLGHSFSGITAQAYVTKYPESVNKVILMDPLITGSHYQRLTDRLNTLTFDMYPELGKKIMEIRSRGLKSSAPEHQAAYIDNFADFITYFYWYTPTPPPVRWDSITFNNDLYYKLVGQDADFTIEGDIKNLDFVDKLAKLGKPTLLISGRVDQAITPKELTKFHERLGKNSQLVFMEKSGHFPWMEEPEKTLEQLTTFLSAGTR